jgi:hypothetical protein
MQVNCDNIYFRNTHAQTLGHFYVSLGMVHANATYSEFFHMLLI